MTPDFRQATRQWTLAQPVVSAFVGSIVRDVSARDDVLQETAVAVLEAYDRYDTQRPFLPWCLAIARNQVRLYLRTRHRDRLVFSEVAMQAVAEAFARESREPAEVAEHLTECLERLTARARRVCELRYHEGVRPAEIGRRLAQSAENVRKILQRARESLRDCLASRRSSWMGDVR